ICMYADHRDLHSFPTRRSSDLYASVAATAADCGLNVIAPAEPDAAGLERTVEGLQPDFIFSFYYRSLLPEALLDCARRGALNMRSEEHTSELQSRGHLVCRLLL